MNKIIFTLMILMSFSTYAADKPANGHPFVNMKVQNFVREIDKSTNLRVIAPGWIDVLQRQPIKIGKGAPSLDKLKAINDRINAKQSFAHAPWLTPTEFYNVKQADCKAYATTKYYELRELGWEAKDLNFWSGDYKGSPHMILVARLGDKQYVLDIMDQSLPEAKDYFYKHFVPSYRFNEKGLDIN